MGATRLKRDLFVCPVPDTLLYIKSGICITREYFTINEREERKDGTSISLLTFGYFRSWIIYRLNLPTWNRPDQYGNRKLIPHRTGAHSPLDSPFEVHVPPSLDPKHLGVLKNLLQNNTFKGLYVSYHLTWDCMGHSVK